MKTYGWPIKFAKSLPELVGAMKDAILGMFLIGQYCSTADILDRTPQLLRKGRAAS
jgi:hypothetical protein